MREKLQTVLIILAILTVLSANIHSIGQPPPNAAPIDRTISPLHPFIYSFAINDNYILTTSETVTLMPGIRGNFTHFRASEHPAFEDEPHWRPYEHGTPIIFNLSEGYGDKTVYFQVMLKIDDNEYYSNQKADMIDFVKILIPSGPPDLAAITSDPKISHFSIAIDNVTISDVYLMNVSYQLRVEGPLPPSANVNDLKIDLNVIPNPQLVMQDYAYPPISSQEISYAQASQQSTYNGQIQFYLHEISPSSGGFICPDDTHGTAQVKIKVSIRLPEGFIDDVGSNNVKTKIIRWTREPIINGKSIKECDWISGGKDDFSFSLGSIPRFAYVGCSIIDLHDCGEVVEPSNKISCDRDPENPIFGTRSVNWVTKPTNENLRGKVHWWCEGYANPKPEGNVATMCSENNGIVTCDNWPYFFFNVYTYIYEPYVVQ